MPLLTHRDIADIKATLAEMASFTEEPIIYRKHVGVMAGDPAFGAPETAIYDEIATGAMFRELTIEEIAVSGGVYVRGDAEFTIRKQDWMLHGPEYADLIVRDGVTYRPKSISRMWLGEVLWYDVRAGRV